MRLFHLWLYQLYRQAPAPPAEVVALPPRLRHTLDLLLDGHGVKAVAARLGLSRHTVNDYSKALHHRLGVSTRGELLRRYLPTRRSPGLTLPAGLGAAAPV